MSSPIARLGDHTWSSDAEPTVLPVDGEDADAVLDALGSGTARTLFREITEEPGAPSELAVRVDSSVQNVHYHLSNLESADLVEVVGTRYSEKGNEMSVYGLAADPIVLVGEATPPDRSRLERALGDWLAGVATLALVSLAVQVAAERLIGGDAAGFFEPASRGVGDGALSVLSTTVAEPGVLFFVGGLLVFLVASLRGRE